MTRDRRPLLPLLAIALAALTSLYYVIPAAVADYSTLKTRHEIERLRDSATRAPSPQAWALLRDDLLQAAAWSPDNPRWYDDLGFLHVLRARSTQGIPELADLRRSLHAEAAAYYRKAAQLRPMFPYGWANLALAKHHAGQDDAEMWAAFDKALAYGRHEIGVERMLAELAFARWQTLDTQRASAIKTMVAETRGDLRQPLLELATYYSVSLPPTAASNQPAPPMTRQ
jgi:hypothetical protein